MSEGYVKRLLDPADTVNVLMEMPIVTNDHFKNRLTATSRTSGVVVQNYEHVLPGDRVSYFDLRVDNMTSKHLDLHVESVSTSANYKSGLIFKTWKNLRPCYYLPYRKQGTTRMKLSPPPGYAGDEVLFFSTATIDGCSVYVEGPAATPKVSHLNALQIAPPPSPKAPPETDLAKQGRIAAKIQDMDARMNIIKKGPATVIERPDYIEDFAPGKTAAKQQFANSKHIPLTQVTDYQPFGAVVGVFSNGGWKFFVQKNGRFQYRPTPVAPEVAEFQVLSATEFWPSNVGGFRIF